MIQSLKAYQIFDSRGNPTIEVELRTDRGVFTAAVPSGASTGAHEAVELRDNKKDEYLGKGVSQAISNVNDIISPKLIDAKLDVTDQKKVDHFLLGLDDTKNKSKLGANAILGVSMAVCRAGAFEKNVPLYRHIYNLAFGQDSSKFILPVPSFNVINGGAHAGNKLAMQEFMIMPVGASSFSEAMRMGAETYQNLKSVIKARFGQDAVNVGDEGGFAPNVNTAVEALDLITAAIEKSGYTGKIKIALDPASSEFFQDASQKYNLDNKSKLEQPKNILSGEEMGEFYANLIKQYPIVSIEDGFAEDDWKSWISFSAKNKDVQVMGDDLTVTNPERIQQAIKEKACNALLLKINQIGTITESIDACNLARKNNWGVMVSHRSGETEDSFIADLVVGLSCGQIKSGAPCRSERLCKYNQLLRIENMLGKNAVYAGLDFKQPSL